MNFKKNKVKLKKLRDEWCKEEAIFREREEAIYKSFSSLSFEVYKELIKIMDKKRWNYSSGSTSKLGISFYKKNSTDEIHIDEKEIFYKCEIDDATKELIEDFLKGL